MQHIFSLHLARRLIKYLFSSSLFGSSKRRNGFVAALGSRYCSWYCLIQPPSSQSPFNAILYKSFSIRSCLAAASAVFTSGWRSVYNLLQLIYLRFSCLSGRSWVSKLSTKSEFNSWFCLLWRYCKFKTFKIFALLICILVHVCQVLFALSPFTKLKRAEILAGMVTTLQYGCKYKRFSHFLICFKLLRHSCGLVNKRLMF